jgi:dTDP-4-amino-4,6-dideoxygalactose transaminase
MNNPYKLEYQSLAKLIKKRFDLVFASGVYILGENVSKFETEFAQYIGTKKIVGLANGLDAIQVALMTLGVGKGDEVITTSLSAVATTLAITRTGAKPIFVDIDEYFHLDAQLLEQAITPKTKAIVPVHLYGQSVAIAKIKQICKAHNLYLIEDVAQAHGATYRGQMLGSFGDAGAFSFYPTKNLGGYGDGGALSTANLELAATASMIRNYGQRTRYVHEFAGINSRLDELQAAVLSVKLPYLNEWNKRRRLLADRYNQELATIKGLQVPMIRKDADHVFHQYVVRTNKRDALLAFLKGEEIPALVHYPIPIHKQPCFKQFHSITLPNTEKACQQILSLPIHPFMEDAEQEFILAKITEFFQAHSSE